ncbi:hypothetical protein FA13DRAFT_1036377 [Coprinellus micaceus]|uniref:Uncharacterized protein n=1 Tax=Coprinellus micaceus TaxID=71717 RepID=A0A4Y7SX30_COPMI|nr:hypothetical protein FA13DRAFT_1036377 [Coprinellus micaceus]
MFEARLRRSSSSTTFGPLDLEITYGIQSQFLSERFETGTTLGSVSSVLPTIAAPVACQRNDTLPIDAPLALTRGEYLPHPRD